MSWVRLDCATPMDGRLAGTAAAWAVGPLVATAKRGCGVVAGEDIAPRVMAHLWGPSVEAWELALSVLIEARMLVLRPDGRYEIPGWEAYQTDPGAAARKREERARTVTDVTVTARDIADVTPGHAASRKVTPDRTGQDVTGHDRTEQDRDAAAPRARAHEAAATAPPPDGLAAALERWRLALRGRSGAAPLVVGSLDAEAIMAAVSERGAEYVTRCIDRAAECAGGGGPSLSLLKRIIAEGVHDGPRATNGAKSAKGAKTDNLRVNDSWKDIPPTPGW